MIRGGQAEVPNVRIFSATNASNDLGFRRALVLLIEKRFCWPSPRLGDKQKPILRSALRVKVNLRRVDYCRYFFSVYMSEGSHLRIAQIAGIVGLKDTLGKRPSASSPEVKTCCPLYPRAMAVPVSWHPGSTRAGSDIGIFEQFYRDKTGHYRRLRDRLRFFANCLR